MLLNRIVHQEKLPWVFCVQDRAPDETWNISASNWCPVMTLQRELLPVPVLPMMRIFFLPFPLMLLVMMTPWGAFSALCLSSSHRSAILTGILIRPCNFTKITFKLNWYNYLFNYLVGSWTLLNSPSRQLRIKNIKVQTQFSVYLSHTGKITIFANYNIFFISFARNF